MATFYPLRVLTRQSVLRRAAFPPIHRPQTTRAFSKTPFFRNPRKDSQDRESINTEPTEYSKSGTDSGAADQAEAAFDPSTTSPEQEKKVSEKGHGESNNPLEVSPANPEVSKPRGEMEGGAENSGSDRKSSGAGSGPKAKKL